MIPKNILDLTTPLNIIESLAIVIVIFVYARLNNRPMTKLLLFVKLYSHF